MRLLETSKIELHEFFDAKIPLYAILSHRWEDGEVTFQHFQSGRGPSMAGYKKIRDCCAKAASHGWNYVWIDSCCIDKSSSAELSEAINSMYKWYQRAQVCYAYLSDVPSALDNHYEPNSSLRRSKWFTRGWTLQELLAPDSVEFYSQDWVEIGTKRNMSHLLEEVTSIAILGRGKVDGACVATKMSWAAKRETTREEDQAYCLLGIFDVNMPLLYGEGLRKAFIRLQIEIMAQIRDESIFVWNCPYAARVLPLLAESPAWFKDSGLTSILYSGILPIRRSHLEITKRGVHIEAVLIPSSPGRMSDVEFLMPLNAHLPTVVASIGTITRPALRLRKHQARKEGGVECFTRMPGLTWISVDEIQKQEKTLKTLSIYIQQYRIFFPAGRL